MAHAVKANSFQSRRTVTLARSLLGKLLVRRYSDGSVTRHRITEVEAYDGEKDLACHASKGRTKRTAVMYGPAGVWYVYLCYGVHEMLNLVTGPEDYPAAILIRGVEGIVGPGRVTRHLQIDRQLNTLPMAEESGLWIEDDGFNVPRKILQKGPRIGVAYAGPIWAAKPWRFHFSHPHAHGPKKSTRASKKA